MAYKEYFRVEESLVVTGTTAITTGSVAPAGFQTFAEVATVGDTFPLWIVDTTTTPPTIEASLGTYSAANTLTRTLVPGGSSALVSFLGNTCSVFIARIPGGNAAQTFNVANATSGTEAVPLAQAQADFAALNGDVTENFSANELLFQGGGNLGWNGGGLFFNVGDLTLRAIFYGPGGTRVPVAVGDATSSVEAVTLGQAQADFAALAGLSTQTFNVADAATATEAVALGQAQANFAPILGSTNNTFKVANAFSAAEAVPLGQLLGRQLVVTASTTFVAPYTGQYLVRCLGGGGGGGGAAATGTVGNSASGGWGGVGGTESYTTVSLTANVSYTLTVGAGGAGGAGAATGPAAGSPGSAGGTTSFDVLASAIGGGGGIGGNGWDNATTWTDGVGKPGYGNGGGAAVNSVYQGTGAAGADATGYGGGGGGAAGQFAVSAVGSSFGGGSGMGGNIIIIW